MVTNSSSRECLSTELVRWKYFLGALYGPAPSIMSIVSNFSVDSAVATASDISSITPLAASSASIDSPSSGFSSIYYIFSS